MLLRFKIYLDKEPNLCGYPLEYHQGDQYLSSFLRRIYNTYGVNHPSALHFELEERLLLATGLLDMEGAPIYNGDVIFNTESKKAYIVRYSKKETSPGTEYCGWIAENVDNKFEHVLFLYENFTNCKVVGNTNDTNFSMQNLRDTLMKENPSVT